MDCALPRELERMVETSVPFPHSSGIPTTGIFAEPSTPTNAGVILCHGFLSDKQSRTNRRLTELLVPQGIATFCFDWHGMGETREHFPHMTLQQCQNQLDTAIQVLQERGISRLGLVGSSFGGLLA